MATSSSGGAGGFFASRRNIVGMVLAVLVIVGHLAFGFGAFRPVAAAAAWGVGVLLTPAGRIPDGTGSLESSDARPAVVKRNSPEELSRDLRRRIEGWSTSPLPREVREEIVVVHASLVEVLGNWSRLESIPHHRSVVAQIINSDVPDDDDGVPSSWTS